MPHRTCTLDDCDRPHRARGLCITHYNAQQGKQYKLHDVPCDWCGDTAKKYTANSRYARTFCGVSCRDHALAGHDGVCEIPKDHWARQYGATTQLYHGTCGCGAPFVSQYPTQRRCTAACAGRTRARFVSGECDNCASMFIAETRNARTLYCSERCAKRVAKRRRRAREHNAAGDFRYSQIIRQYVRQGKTCSYCKQPATGLPQPEHVVPLSRGGRNDMSNLVAACRYCNGDKGDLTLSEWMSDRQRRGLPPVDTKLSGPAYIHLVPTEPTTPSLRRRPA